jgi:hypothetical protein
VMRVDKSIEIRRDAEADLVCPHAQTGRAAHFQG